jgi:hypothetical protein
VEDRLANAAALGLQEADVLNRALAQPCPGGGRICGKRPLALDAATDRIVNLGFAREGLNESVDLPGQEAGVVRHHVELVLLEPVLNPRQRDRIEQLGSQGTREASHSLD